MIRSKGHRSHGPYLTTAELTPDFVFAQRLIAPDLDSVSIDYPHAVAVPTKAHAVAVDYIRWFIAAEQQRLVIDSVRLQCWTLSVHRK